MMQFTGLTPFTSNPGAGAKLHFEGRQKAKGGEQNGKVQHLEDTKDLTALTQKDLQQIAKGLNEKAREKGKSGEPPKPASPPMRMAAFGPKRVTKWTQEINQEDLPRFVNIFPAHIQTALKKLGGRLFKLEEVVTDIGQKPKARVTGLQKPLLLAEKPVTFEDLQYIRSHLSSIDINGRGIVPGTLHRASVLSNRTGKPVGFTCRVGKAVPVSLEHIEPYLKAGKSVLILGPAGRGKTTLLREIARTLATVKANATGVMIVDKSNEIAGDGDTVHKIVGQSRRYTPKTPQKQGEAMERAIENHTPKVLVVDEISDKSQAWAARTGRQKGVQLIGTAHGETLVDLLMNPELKELVGNVVKHTVSDETARLQGSKKTVLQREKPAVFDVLIEMRDRHTGVVHEDLNQSIDWELKQMNRSEG